MKKDYNSTEERIFAGFRRFSKILKREEFGHHGKARVLNILAKEGPMNQRDLQDEMEITSSSASDLLKKMEEHGFITRTANPSNAKAYIVEITDLGKEKNKELKKEKTKKTKALFSALTEEEKTQFADMLDKIQASWYEQGMFYSDCKRHHIKQVGKKC